MSNLRKLACRVFLMLHAGCVIGCSPPDPTAPAGFGRTSYEFGFASIAPFDLSDTQLFMDRRDQRVLIAGGGFLLASERDGSRGHLASAPAQIPDKVSLTWSDRKGYHEQAISLAGIVPDMNHFDGTIWFIFDGDGWRTAPATNQQMLQRYAAGKTPVPLGD